VLMLARSVLASIFASVAIASAAGCSMTSTTVSQPGATSATTAVSRPPAPPTPAAAPASAAASGANPIAETAIRAHMEFLASDALNGRGSGTRDEQIAATYIASQFRLWGLEPMGDAGGFVQQVEMGGAQASAAPTLMIGPATFTHGKDMLVTTLGTPGVSGTLAKHRAGVDVPAGAIVLLPEGASPAQAMTASVILLPETPQVRAQWNARGGTMPLIPARVVKLTAPANRPTLIYLDKAAHAAVSAGPDSPNVRFTADVTPTAPTYTWNAVGRITGADPVLSKQIIVLSAHLDHIGARPPVPGTDTINNGADDDASGTVAVMMLAEALAKGPRPKRTVVFALFGSEERGGLGAGFFVDLPVVPLAGMVADLQFEMIGRADPAVPARTLWLTGYERSNLGPELAKQGARLVADPHPEQSFFTRSDNIRFARRGVIAHTVSSYNLHKEYHQPSDEVSKIDFAHMTESIRSMLEPVRWLANSDFKPVWAPGGCPAPCK
jgi:aminopeptidase YwaD